MKIVALVKYSMDIAEIRVDPATHELKTAGAPLRFGDLDKGAVEAAVRIKEKTDDCSTEVLCFGPPAARAAMKDLLAMGADQATIVEDPFDSAADGAVAVRVVAAALRKLEPFDLVLCGFASDDGYSHQTGPRLAELLQLPLVSYASELEVVSGTLVAERDLEEGLQTVSSALPAIASIAEEAFVPRSVTLLQAMKAQKKPIVTWTLSDLGLDAQSLASSSTCESLGETGVVVQRQQNLLKDAELSRLADDLIDALVAEGILVAGADR